MLTSLSLGAEVDIATGDEVAGAKKAIIDKMAGSSTPYPVRLTMAGAVIGVSPQVIDLGRPPRGRIWGVVACTLIGPDAFTTVAGVACALFVGDISNYGLLQCRVPALPVPSFNTFTADGLWVHDSESLFIVTNGAIATTQIGAVTQIEEWRESEISMADGS